MVGRRPPRRYRLDDYKRWFPTTARIFRRYLQRFGATAAPPRGTGRAVGVVVGPWLSTAMPWYSVMLAIGLARRGRNVVILWDDTRFPEADIDDQNRAIGSVLATLEGALPVERLSEQPAPAVSEADIGEIRKFSDYNVTWTMRGAPLAESERPWLRAVEDCLTRALPRVRSALDRIDPDCVVVPGGVYGTSGVIRFAATERGCRVATFDADQHVAQLCVNGVAAQHADVPQAFATLWGSGEEARSHAIAAARAEFTARAASVDRYGFQAQPAGPNEPTASSASGAIVVPLNVEWDTGALGLHSVFADSIDWITSTVSVILDMDAGPVIVRQHPSERRDLQRSKFDVASILRDRFGGDPRCRFVAAADHVNTYDLVRSARLVLPFVSTIGIESAAMGKPTLISGSAYYADLGFVWSPTSRADYFALLERGVRGDLGLLPDQCDRALVCYYLSAVRNRIWTDFTPQPDDFWQWSQRGLDEIFAEPEVADMLEAIDSGVPVALLRHRRDFAGAAS